MTFKEYSTNLWTLGWVASVPLLVGGAFIMSVSHSEPLGPAYLFLDWGWHDERAQYGAGHTEETRGGGVLWVCVLHLSVNLFLLFPVTFFYVLCLSFLLLLCPLLLPVLSLPEALVLFPLMLHLLLHCNYYCVVILFFILGLATSEAWCAL